MKTKLPINGSVIAQGYNHNSGLYYSKTAYVRDSTVYEIGHYDGWNDTKYVDVSHERGIQMIESWENDDEWEIRVELKEIR